jgi:hypothetical protein
MAPREILRATQGVMLRPERGESDLALIALHNLLVNFLDATDQGCPESMKAMSIDQARLLNHLHLAVGL